MIELPQIIEVAKQYERSPLPLEVNTICTPKGDQKHLIQVLSPPMVNGFRAITAHYFRRLLRLHSIKQREAADLFIEAMRNAHQNTEAVNLILRSERIKPNKPITANQAIRAYQKLELIEFSRYEFVNGDGKLHRKGLQYIHGLILKIVTHFR